MGQLGEGGGWGSLGKEGWATCRGEGWADCPGAERYAAQAPASAVNRPGSAGGLAGVRGPGRPGPAAAACAAERPGQAIPVAGGGGGPRWLPMLSTGGVCAWPVRRALPSPILQMQTLRSGKAGGWSSSQCSEEQSLTESRLQLPGALPGAEAWPELSPETPSSDDLSQGRGTGPGRGATPGPGYVSGSRRMPALLVPGEAAGGLRRGLPLGPQALMGIGIPGDSALWEPERERVPSMAQHPHPSLSCTLSRGTRPGRSSCAEAEPRPSRGQVQAWEPSRSEVARRCCPPPSFQHLLRLLYSVSEPGTEAPGDRGRLPPSALGPVLGPDWAPGVGEPWRSWERVRACGQWRCHVGCDVSRVCRQVSGSLQPPGLSTSSLSTPGSRSAEGDPPSSGRTDSTC